MFADELDLYEAERLERDAEERADYARALWQVEQDEEANEYADALAHAPDWYFQ